MKKVIIPVAVLVLVSGVAFGKFETGNTRPAQDTVRVVKEGAVLRLYPDPNSTIIQELSIGSVFEFENLVNGWFKLILSPNTQGNSIIGYVHPSFVEIEKRSIQLERESKPVLDSQNDYYNWKKEFTQAQNMKSTGIVSLVIGTALLSPSLYFVIRGPGYGDYYTWAKILMGAGIAIGTLSIIGGIFQISKGNIRSRQLVDEGLGKGYIGAGFLPNYGAVGIQIGFSF